MFDYEKISHPSLMFVVKVAIAVEHNWLSDLPENITSIKCLPQSNALAYSTKVSISDQKWFA
jgi:hypothetical protein